MAVLPVDEQTGFVYWTDFNADEIWRANPDGSNVVKLADTNTSPSGLAIDTVNDYIYFITYNGTMLHRLELDGKNSMAVSGALSGQGIDVAVDPAGGKVYYTKRDGGVYRANLNGTNHETFITGQSVAQGLSIDVESNKVYWINAASGTIRYADLGYRRKYTGSIERCRKWLDDGTLLDTVNPEESISSVFSENS